MTTEVELKREFFWGHYPMSNLQYAIDNNLSDKQKDIADCMDMIFYHYKKYLISFSKTLHRTMFEIRRFRDSGVSTDEFNSILELIENTIEKQILDCEYYEIMQRFLDSQKRIYKILTKEL